ncbi:hypothetical protein Gogos_001308, partial [Gossypium gossypioides]|nr:hypothetical protein [Gossypium gossypioides]
PQKYLRIRVCLDVTAPLKRKKKVLLTIEPSKIVFGWDLLLRAVVRRRNTVVSRWLRAADGSPCIAENLASFKHSNSLNAGKDLGHNSRGFVGNLNSNPNLILLGSVQNHGIGKLIKGRDGSNDALVTNGLVYGPMDLVLDEENDLITLSDGKKRQRIVKSSCVLMDANVGSGSMDVSASSGD